MKTATSKKNQKSSYPSNEMVTVSLDVKASRTLRKAAVTSAKVGCAVITVTNGNDE